MAMKHIDLSPSSCHPRIVAENPLGAVAVCADCGHVHLTLQHLTVRFDPEAFLTLAALITQAGHHLRNDGAPLSHTLTATTAGETVH